MAEKQSKRQSFFFNVCRELHQQNKMTRRRISHIKKEIQRKKGILLARTETDVRFVHDYDSPVPPHNADGYTTELRQRKFRQVLLRRTNRIRIVVDDCSDIHNATAVMRSCDCFGIQHIHIITQVSEFKVNKHISKGAHIYVDMHFHNSIEECYEELREHGYRIYTSDLAAPVIYNLDEMKEKNKTEDIALVFGCEGFGLSPEASELADGCFMIPMQGLSQSLNLSVSAAITMYTVRAEAIVNDERGDLTDEEQCERYDKWITRLRGEVSTSVDTDPELGIPGLFQDPEGDEGAN